MKIIEALAHNLKKLLYAKETKNLVTYTGASGIPALRWERSQSKNKQKPIYCVLSHRDNFHEMNTFVHMSTALQQALGREQMGDLVFLSAENSPLTMENSVLPELRNSEPGHIVTPGIWTTHCIIKELEGEGLHSSMLFSGVNDISTISTQYAQDSIPHAEQITGIQHRPMNYTEFVAGMKDITMGLQRILLPFDRTITSQELVAQGHGINDTQRAEFDFHNIRVTPVPVMSGDNIGEALAPLIQYGDGILVSNDPTAIVGLSDILNVAHTRKIPVFAESNMAVMRGASLGMGGSGVQDGIRFGSMIYKMDAGLAEKPGALPVVTVDRDHEIRFNKGSFKRQGIRVSSKHMRALNMRAITAGE